MLSGGGNVARGACSGWSGRGLKVSACGHSDSAR